jgi:hypothetical protein
MKSLRTQGHALMTVKHLSGCIACFVHAHEISRGLFFAGLIAATSWPAMKLMERKSSSFRLLIAAIAVLLFADAVTAAVLIPEMQKIWSALPFNPLTLKQAFYILLILLQLAEYLWRKYLQISRHPDEPGPRGTSHYHLEVGPERFAVSRTRPSPTVIEGELEIARKRPEQRMETVVSMVIEDSGPAELDVCEGQNPSGAVGKAEKRAAPSTKHIGTRNV